MAQIKQPYQKQEVRAAFLFLGLSAIGFLVFNLGPTVFSFFLSMVEWDILGSRKFIGLANFSTLFSDENFGKSLLNTGYYVIFTVPIMIFIALITAVFLREKFIKFKLIFRTIYFLPYIVSAVSIAIIWQAIYETDGGALNALLAAAGITGRPWLTSPAWAMPSVIVVGIYKQIGFNMVIFLAAIQAIPDTLYEAAWLDGASRIRIFFRITIPLVTPTIYFLFVTAIIGSFQVFDLTSILTAGGPAYATNTIAMFIYDVAFKQFRAGYASAAAIVLFFTVILITRLQSEVSKRWVHY